MKHAESLADLARIARETRDLANGWKPNLYVDTMTAARAHGRDAANLASITKRNARLAFRSALSAVGLKTL